MWKQRWGDTRVTKLLGRATRGVLTSVGALTVAGAFAAAVLSKQSAQQKLQLPKGFVLVLDFEGSDIVEKPVDAFTKFQSGILNQVSLSKMVDALRHAGSDKRIQGVIGCIGDGQKHAGLAQVQELRNAVLTFRKLKQDTVPTVAYSDSFGEGGGSGTLGYYLASAFDQIYVQETGLISFTGFAASVPFLRGLLDRWHVKPLAFAREEYKSVVSQWTDKGYSKPNKDATQAWLNGWMGQIVHDVAQSRGITTQQVVKALHTSPLSVPEAAAAGLITAANHRSTAMQTLLHSSTSAANPATLIGTNQELCSESEAAKKVGAAILHGMAPKSGSAHIASDSDSVAQALHSVMHVSDTVALKLSPEAQSSGSTPAVSLAQLSAADAELPSDISSKPVQPADPALSNSSYMLNGKQLGQQSSAEGNADLVHQIQAAPKPLKNTLVVQINPKALVLKSCPAVPISKYIQVLEHERQKAMPRSSMVQKIRAALQGEEEEAANKTGTTRTGVTHKPQIAVITATGVIVAGKSVPGLRQQKQIGSSELGMDLQKARHDPNVKAVVLRVDSPGGSAVGSDAIYQEVLKVQQAGKPVVVSMGNLAASGGYYISASANKIVAQPGSITGSIGVAFGKLEASQALQDQGINVDTVAVGKNATTSSLFHDFTKEQRRQVNTMMDRTYANFLSRVALGRNMSMEEARKVAKGRVWTGEDALQHGLVDRLGGLTDALQLAKQEAHLPLGDNAVEVVDFPPVKSVIQLLREALDGQSSGFGTLAAAVQLAQAQSGSSFGMSMLAPVLWPVLAAQGGLYGNAALPGAVSAAQGVQMMNEGSLITGLQSHAQHLEGVQMLHTHTHVH